MIDIKSWLQALSHHLTHLTFHTVGPILAQNYTVIAVNLRGIAQSTIPRYNDHTAETLAEDLKGVLDFLKISKAYVFSHDQGGAPAAALSIKYPSLVQRVGISEFPLPGFGFETVWVPQANWDLYRQWQAAFLSVPEAAQHSIQGREREYLAWYFFHASYSGNSVISNDHLDRYAREISKPGFPRSGLEYYGVDTISKDAIFFKAALGSNPLTQPVLILGGEASFAPVALQQRFLAAIGKDMAYDVVPKAGHWIGK